MKKYYVHNPIGESRTVSKLATIIFTIIFFAGFLLIYTPFLGIAETNKYDVKVETIDGVKVFTNPDYPREGTDKLKVRHELTIGENEEGDALIYRPNDVQADSRGNIYIWEWGMACMKVFDNTGRFLRKIGRKGEGPGEFTQSASFTLLDDNKIYLLDSAKRRITIFSTDGELIRDFRYNIKWFCSELNSDGKSQLYIIRDMSSFGKEAKTKFQLIENENHLYRYDTIKNKWHFLRAFKGEHHIVKRQGEGITGLSSPFTIVWQVNSEGDLIAGLNKTYRLGVFSPQGKLKFKFGRHFTPKKNKRAKKGKKLFGSVNKIFEFFPAFGRKILTDQKSRIWIEQYKFEDRFTKVTYDIFSKDGIYIKQVIFPYRIYQFKNNKIYGISVTEDEERIIKRSVIISGLD